MAYLYNGDKFSALNLTGLVICMGGVILHVVLKLIEQDKRLAPLESGRNPTEQRELIAKALLTSDLDDWDDIDLEDLNTGSKRIDS